MAFKKKMWNWQRIKAGDIISFTYQSSRSNAKKNNCILVLNPKLPVTRKDGTNSFHLTGIKLKENGSIYITKNELLKETKNRLCGRIGSFLMQEHDSFEIDNPVDWLVVETILKNKHGITD